MLYRPQICFHRSGLCRQRGDFLLESLIGMALMAIIGMGVMFVTSKASTSQRDSQMQDIAVNQMRAALVNNGTNNTNICANLPNVVLPVGVAQVALQGCNNGRTITATINNTAVAGVPTPIFISATSEQLGGQVVVGGSWQ